MSNDTIILLSLLVVFFIALSAMIAIVYRQIVCYHIEIMQYLMKLDRMYEKDIDYIKIALSVLVGNNEEEK